MKITYKLIFAFLIVSSLIGGVGIFSYEISKNVLIDSIGTTSNNVALQVLHTMDLRLDDNVNLFQILSKESTMQSFMIKSNDEYANLKNPEQFLIDMDSEWISLPDDEISPFMLDLINNDMSEIFRSHQKYYDDKFDYIYFGEVFATNAFGANIAQTGKTSDYNQSDEIWWQVAKSTGVHVSEIEYDTSAQIFSRDISIRVDDVDGNFLGVVKHVINVREIFDLIDNAESSKNYESQDFTLLDNNYNMIYSTSSFYDNSMFLQSYPYQFILDNIDDKMGHFISPEGSFGDEQLISYVVGKQYSDSSSDWILVTDYDTSEVFESVFHLQLIIFVISGLITLVAIIFGLYISNSISKPVSMLKNELQLIEHGDFRPRSLPKSDDEIGQLTESIQEMSKELKNTVSREKDLAVANTVLENQRLAFIGQLAARLAHDIRNPLSIIQITLENFQVLYDTNDKQKKQFDKVQRSIFRIAHQINDVLDFVKVQSLIIKKSKVSDVIADALDSLFIPDGIKLILPKNDAEIFCDLRKFPVLLNNLILNAIQALDGNGSVELRLKENSNNIILEIEDSGPGISSNNLEKIFEPLFTTKQSGTGLGLASVKSIIDAHGGTIHVTSPPTIFVINLPKSK